MNAIRRRLDEYHRGREPERLKLKYQRIADDPLSFFRGTPNLFFENWPVDSSLHSTPQVWLCGDLHLENFGAYRGDNRCTYFDFNDFDEACLGPLAWDLARLITSAAIEAQERNWSKGDTEALGTRIVASYASALATGKARWVERETAKGLMHELLETLHLRTWAAFLKSRTRVDVRRRRFLRVDHGKALPLKTRREAKELEAFIANRPAGGLRYLDAARRIAGNSSLGVPRYVILVEDREENLFLLDLKMARPAVALAFPSVAGHALQPVWPSEAHRVTGVQAMVQAIPPAFLEPVEFQGEWWVLRELMPGEDRVEIAEASSRKFTAHAESLGEIVAWGHLRASGRKGSATIDALSEFAERKDWRKELVRFAVASARQNRRDWQRFCERR